MELKIADGANFLIKSKSVNHRMLVHLTFFLVSALKNCKIPYVIVKDFTFLSLIIHALVRTV